MADPAAQLPALDLSSEERAAADAQKKRAKAQQLIAELGAAEKAQAKWLAKSRKIVKKYRKDGSETQIKRQFALLWSNTETVRPAIYSRPPIPVVMRRFGDADPVGRVVTEVLERSLKYSEDAQDLDGVLKQASLDYVLISRATTWERYVPTFGPQVTPEVPLQLAPDLAVDDDPRYVDDDQAPVDSALVQMNAAGQPFMPGEPFRPVEYEESITDYVNYEDFGHNVARTWDEVDLVYRRTYLGRKALKTRFGDELGDKIPLDWGGQANKPKAVDDDHTKKAAIYEVWIKSEKKVYWISKGWSEAPLDVRDDPLKLEGFFPCPRPLLANLANDSLIPTPDYVYWQDQGEEIDDLTDKICDLQKALKVVGLYAGDAASTVATAVQKSNGGLIPVPDWMKLKESGGVKGLIEWWPIDMVAQALQAMIAQRQQLINDVYQVTGVADILRGMNDPRATATAEAIKGQWGTLRIRDRQKEMQRFARDALAIKGQVIAQKFGIDTLKAMTQVELPMQADKDAILAAQQQQMQLAQLQAARAAQAQAMQGQMQGPMPGGPMMGPGGPPPQPGGPPQAPPQPSPMMGHNGGPPMPPPPPPPQPTPEEQKVLASPTWEDVLGRLRDNALRCFTIDIETDSTIEPNEQEEKARVSELLTALGGMIAQWGPVIKEEPAMAPMVGELIKWALRKFRAGREVEDVVDRSINEVIQNASSAQAGPPPDPAAQAAQATAAAKLQEAAMKQQTEAQKTASAERIAQSQQAIDAQHVQIDAAELQLKQGDQQLKAMALARDPHPQAIQ